MSINSPIPFIQYQDNKFVVSKEAAEFLSKLEGKISTVIVAGPYRTGKSFLLNRMLNKQKGFQVGETIQACTKGIWIWGEPVKYGDIQYLFMDSEGLGSLDQSQTFDTQIFSLAVLLSSLFILNTQGTINESALEQLELVVQCTQQIRVKDMQDKKEKSAKEGKVDPSTDNNVKELAHHFPFFLWVLRDFVLRLEDTEGKPLSPTQYLEDALRVVQSERRNVQEKNRVRQTITNVFPNRDCMTLVRPVTDESELQTVHALPLEKLRVEFRNQMDYLQQKVYAVAKPKTVNGVAINGQALVGLAQAYTAALNNGALPTIESAWLSVMKANSRETLDAAYNHYIALFKHFDTDEKLVMESDDLEQLNKKGEDEALQILKTRAIGDESHMRNLENDIKKKISQFFADRTEKNKSRSLLLCRRLIDEIWTKSGIEEKINLDLDKGGYRSGDELINEHKQFVANYLSHAIGPHKHPILNSHLDLKHEMMFRAVLSRSLKQQQVLEGLKENIKKLEEKMAADKEDWNRERNMMFKEREQNAQINQQNMQRIDDMHTQINSLNNRIETERQKYEKVSSDMKDQIMQLTISVQQKESENIITRTNLELVKQEKASLENAKRDLENTVANHLNTISQLNRQNSNLSDQLSREHEALIKEQTRCEDLKTEVATLKKTLEHHQKQAASTESELKKEVAKLQDLLERSTQENRDQKTVSQNFESRSKEVEEKLAQLTQQFEKLTSDYKASQETNSQILNEKKQLDQRLQEKEKTVTELQTNVRDLTAQTASQENQIRDLTEKNMLLSKKVTKANSRETMEGAFQAYARCFTNFDNNEKTVLDSEQLNELHRQADDQASKVINMRPIDEQLKFKISNFFNERMEKNKNRSLEMCRVLLNQFWNERGIEDKVVLSADKGGYTNGDELISDFKQFLSQYHNEACGPYKFTVLSSHLEAKNEIIIRQMYQTLFKHIQVIQDLKESISQLEKKVAEDREYAAKERELVFKERERNTEQQQQNMQRIDELRKEIRDLNGRMESEKNRFEKMIAELNDTIIGLRGQIKEREGEILLSNREKVEIDAKRKELEGNKKELEAAVANLQSQLSASNAQIAQLNTQLQQREGEIQLSNREKAEIDAKRKELEGNRKDLEAAVTNLRSQLSSCNTQIAQLNIQLQQKDDSISSLNESLSKLKQEKVELENEKKENGAIRRELDFSKKELESNKFILEANLASIQQQLQFSKKQESNLSEALSREKAKYEELQNQIQSMQRQAAISDNDLHRQLTSLNQNVQQLTTQMNETNEKLSVANQKLQQANTNLDNSEQKNRELEEKIRQLQSSIEETKSRMEDYKTKANKYDETKLELTESKYTVSDYKTKIADLQSKYDSLVTKLEETKEQLYITKSQLQRASEELTTAKQQYEKSQTEVLRLSNDSKQQDIKIHQNASHLQEAEKKINQLSQENKDLLTQLSEQQHKIGSLEEKLATASRKKGMFCS